MSYRGGQYMNSDELSSGIMDTLTTRERDVFTLLLKGMKEKDIALALGISRSGVGFFTKKIYKKLRVHSKPELIVQYAVNTNQSSDEGEKA